MYPTPLMSITAKLKDMGGHDREVVADSEDEDSMIIDRASRTFSANRGLDSNTSPIQTANFTPLAIGTGHPSTTISAFTQGTTTSLLLRTSSAILPTASDSIATATSTNLPRKPPPKSLPAYKETGAFLDPADTSSSHNVSSISATTPSTKPTSEIQTSTNSSSVAPGAPKSRPRPKPIFNRNATDHLAVPSLSTIENDSSVAPNNEGGTSGGRGVSGMPAIGDDLFASDISERAKVRSQQRKAKQKPKPPPVIDDIIELSSDHDEMPPPPPKPKAKSKPKPKQPTRSSPRKKLKTSHKLGDLVSPVLTPISLPMPTSDFNIAPSSQLPPSDPPLPSTATVPPTSTPPSNAHPREPTPHSSPVLPPRKRKRTSKILAFQDADDIDLLRGPLADKPESRVPALPPPLPEPLFFPSSSASGPPPQTSSDIPSVPQSDKPAKPSRKRKAPAPKASGVQDPLADIDGEIIQKPKPKRRRKKDEEDEEEWAGDDVSTVKPKAKNARKKKAAPAKPKNQGSKSRMQMVVEITEGKGSPRKKPISVSGSGSNLRLEEPRKKPEDQSGASAVLQPDGVPQNPKPAENEESSELSVLESDVEGNPGKKKGKDAKKFGAKEPSGSSSSKTAGSAKSRGKRRAVVESDEDDGEERGIRSSVGKVKGVDASEGSRSRHSTVGVVRSSLDAGLDSAKGKSREKENKVINGDGVAPSSSYHIPSSSSKSNSSPRYAIAKSTPMTELLRKVNSTLSGSPLASSRPVHSPYLKASRSLLRKIAPLHPNRRTPPPPPPRLPPPKKTKKQLDLEEKWEMELEDSIDGWFCLPEEERAALRRAKRNTEMGFED